MLRPQAARLLAVDREGAGTRLLLLARDEAVVGSAEGAPLHLPDPSVTYRHATIRYARGRYYVVDLKSAEGTFVNGRRIRRRQALKHGDIIRFGGATPYRFIDPDALKRRRWRRIIRASAVVALLVAVGLLDHFEKWNLLSLSTAKEIVAWVDSHATSKPVEAPIAPIAKAASTPAPAASIARASSTPAASIARAPSTPAAVASVARVAAPAPVVAPKSTRPSPTTKLVTASCASVAGADELLSRRLGPRSDSRQSAVECRRRRACSLPADQFRRRHAQCKADERGCVRGEARQGRLLDYRRGGGAETSSWRGVAARTT